MIQLLENKIIFITGGASGIGRATALTCAREGAKLAIADIADEQGEQLIAELHSHNTEAIYLHTDVTQATQVEQAIQHVVSHFGRLDCAFNNAGIEGEIVRTADVTEADFDRIMAVNLKGVWLCLKYELRQMLQQGSGAIVNTASAAGLVGTHSMPVYGASKHGVVGLTRSAAVEYGRKGIRVNAVCPSVIRTPMMDRVFERLPQFYDATIRLNPSRRLGEAQEVAEAVVWLLSDKASFVNGATLTVDGGFTAQ
ncbi:MAG: SDR family oxidoreductase [Chloroflexi bacterium]|nr:MAG: SDR family oxidoreductase [Chloroflexota bacterium]